MKSCATLRIAGGLLRILPVVILLAAVLLGSLPASAATWTVQDSGDSVTANAANCPGAACRLRDALAKAASGDTIDFAGDMTINVAARLSPSLNVTIDGSGHSITLMGNADVCQHGSCYSLFLNVKATTLKNLTFRNGGERKYYLIWSDEIAATYVYPSVDGGAIYNFNDLTLQNCTFYMNGGRTGGAVYNYGTLNVQNSAFTSNQGFVGGAIYNSGAATITGSAFTGNDVIDKLDLFNSYCTGGAIENVGTLTLEGSYLAHNSTHSTGGAVNTTGNALIRNNSFLENSGLGASLHAPEGPPYPTVTVYNNTFVNTWSQVLRGHVTDFRNNIVNGGCGRFYCDTCGSNMTNYTDLSSQCPGSTYSTATLVGSVGNYGGAAPSLPLLPGSAAIDAGDSSVCPATDQRGVARPKLGSCDIGAFESQGVTIGSATGSSQQAEVNSVFPLPLTLTVTPNGAGEPVGGGVVNFTPTSVNGASATLTPATIAADGTVSVTATANGTAGGPYQVLASVLGAPPAYLNYSLTNLPYDSFTTTTVASSANPALLGQSVTLTATTVSTSSGSAVPGGSVTFLDNGVTISGCSAKPLGASCITSALAFGSHSIVAHYNAYSNYLTSSSAPLTQTVRYTSTTAITSAPNPSDPGQNATFTVTVSSSGSGTPTGTVTFQGVTGCGNVALDGNGQAACTTSALLSGPHTNISASYSGDVGFAPSSSASYSHTVTCSNAMTVTNNSDSDEGSLRQALLGTCAGGTITFADDYDITLATTLTIAQNVTIDGSGHAISVSGNNLVRVFYLNSGIALNMSHLTVKNGSGPTTGTIRYGGGIYSAGTLNLSNCNFTGNTSESLGGAIYSSGTLNLSNCTFTGNTGTNGGAIITSGGTLTDCVFSGNSTTYSAGGAIYSSRALTLTRCTFSNNTAVGSGGAVMFSGTTYPLAMDSCTFNGNSAATGGAILAYSSNATIINSSFTGNSSTSEGGAIYNYSALTITNSVFSGNSANTGGGIYNTSNPNTLTVTNSSFSGNSATIGGGAFDNSAGIVSFTNSSFSGNSATSGGGIRNESGTVTVTNSIVAASPAGGNCSGTIGGSTNLADDSSCGAGFTNSAAIKLAPLGSYGGSTQTMALLPGSSAIKGATSNCPATDQRGSARASGAGPCDMGAYESHGFTLAKSGGDNQSAGINTGFANPLAVTLTETGGSPIPGVTVTFTAPGSGPSAGLSTGSAVTGVNGIASVNATANGVLGSYTVTASADGVGSVDFSLSNQLSQTITFNDPGTQFFGTTPTLSATSTSGLTVSFTSGTPGVCTITTGGTLAFVATGACTINADQAGDAGYGPAPTVSHQFGVVLAKVNAVVMDPAAPVNLYAVVDGGGVFRSTNSGSSWTRTPGQPGSNRLQALVLVSGSPNTLYAASYGSGIFSSTDSGATWNSCTGQPADQNVVALIAGSSGLYAGTEGGVFKSQDCSSWTPINTGLAVAADKPVVAIAIDPAAPEKLYAGLDGGGIYRSTDSGASWTAASGVDNKRVKGMVIKPGDGTQLYAAIYGGGVYKSTDSGASWGACANTNLSNLNVLTLVIDAGGRLYAGTEAGVFVSRDGCGSWAAINGGLP